MTMLERMAIAAFFGPGQESEWAKSPDYYRQACLQEMRAALLAIRGPDETLHTYVFEQALDVDWTDFARVIDAILADKPEGGA